MADTSDQNDTGVTKDSESLDVNVLFAEQPSDKQENTKDKEGSEIRPEKSDTYSGEETSPIPKVEPQAKLLWALKNDKFDEFVKLLKDPVVNIRFQYKKPTYSDYGTCIEIASRLSNRGRYVKALLKAGVKPNVHEILPEPIHYAAREGNSDTLKILLEDKRTNINIVDSFERNALHLAVRYSKQGIDEKYAECITMLLKRRDLDVNKPNKKGYTPIHEAANSRREAVELILQYRHHDLDLDTCRPSGRSARELILSKYPDLRPLLPKMQLHKLAPDINTQLLLSLQNRELKDFSKILKKIDDEGDAKADPNFFYGRPYNATCLEIACRDDDCSQFVQQLLNAGADPNIVNPISKQIPLHLAAEAGNENVLSVLLEDRRTNINIINVDGKSVLHILAEFEGNKNQNKNIIKCLKLIFGKHKRNSNKIAIQVNLTNKDGKMAVEIALEKNNMEFVKTMLQQVGTYMDLDVIVGEENRTLYDVILLKFPELKEAIPAGRDFSQKDRILDLFQLLYNEKSEEFVNALQSKGEDESMDIDDGNYTLLQYATLHDLIYPVKELLLIGVNPNKTTDFEKRPPIIIASQRNNQEILQMFLDNVPEGKLDVNVADSKGNTALHFASKNENIECVLGLIRHGANYRIRNIFDKCSLSADAVSRFLDRSLLTNGKYPEDEEYELIFDYKLLSAYKASFMTSPSSNEDKRRLKDPERNSRIPLREPSMDFLLYISESAEHRHLLKHPIITSFLEVKDFQVRLLSYVYISICFMFVLMLNCYIIVNIGQEDSELTTSVTILNIIAKTFIGIYLALCAVILACKLMISPKDSFFVLTNWIHVLLITCIGSLLFINLIPPSLAVAAIFLSWFKLILMTYRRTALSINFEILKRVSLNYIQFLFSYVPFIIAFAFSFYCVLHGVARKQHEDDINHNRTTEQHYGYYMTPWLSIQKVFIMMVGEFEANDFLPVIKDYTTCFWLLSFFVFIMAMVLVNLLTGLAVNDIQNIKENAIEVSLAARVRLFYNLDLGGLFTTRKVNIFFINLLNSFAKRFKSLPSNISLEKIHIFPNKGPTIILDGYRKSSWKMNLSIMRDALLIISNPETDVDNFNVKQAFEGIRDNYDHIIARLRYIEQKLEIQSN